jgi:hypothetical protein
MRRMAINMSTVEGDGIIILQNLENYDELMAQPAEMRDHLIALHQSQKDLPEICKALRKVYHLLQ